MKQTDLKNLPTGTISVITGFTADYHAARLVVMGLGQGSLIEVIRKSPFNDAVYIKCGNLRMALRNDEAESIIVSYE